MNGGRSPKIALLLCLLLVASSSQAVYKVKKKQKKGPTRIEKLEGGKIIAQADFSKRGIWAGMEAVIEAPPEIVWKLFVQANDWKKYHVHDSRALSPEMMEQAPSADSVEDIYKIIGDQTFDPLSQRLVGKTWEAGTFQYYDLKWPLEDRWVVFTSHHDETDMKKGIYRSAWSKLGGNVRLYEGSLLLEPFEDDHHRTHLQYSVESHLGGFVPKFLVRWAVGKSIPEVIKAIRREAVRVWNEEDGSTHPDSGSEGPKNARKRPLEKN